MTISELIKWLEGVTAVYGDLPVMTCLGDGDWEPLAPDDPVVGFVGNDDHRAVLL